MADDAGEMTPTERAALITVRLLRGEKLSNAQVVALCGYTERHSAYYLMMRLARVLPLTYCNGVWQLMGNSCDPF